MKGRKSQDPNLRKEVNINCLGKCTKDDRKKITEDDLCKHTVSTLDQLPVRCVGEWSYKKIYRLVQYYGIFVNGMHKRWKGDLNYLEICSGPGRCIYREIKEEVDGTSLAIVNHESFDLVRKALFVDNNPKVVKTLNQRISNLGKSNKAIARVGDYNDLKQMEALLNTLPKNCLNLTLIDPTECNIPFSTIKLIKRVLKNVDMIINIAVYTDTNRNINNAVRYPSRYGKVLEKYGNFLGDMDFLRSEEIKNIAEKKKINVLLKHFIDHYIEQLASIGYTYHDVSVVVQDKGRPLYRLLFLSAHPRGLDLWRKTLKWDEKGQGQLLPGVD